MTIEIDPAILERACKEIIETILLCLPNTYKGTVYRIGKPPEMVAERITSGIIDRDRKEISWGLPQRSEYNPPGKPWVDYMDKDGRPLEAMAWCVEKQKSWTAEDVRADPRSVRLQVEGAREDYHHMEPVLTRKRDLYFTGQPPEEYPRDSTGNILWKDSDYLVVAVIKIHFLADTVKIGSPETRLIKKLSRALGTELLSYQLKQQSLVILQRLAEDKLNSCNILADSLRNAITKSGVIFSLIKLEIGLLRQRWEEALLEERNALRTEKSEAVRALNRLTREVEDGTDDLQKDLVRIHNEFLELSLPPEVGERWVRMRIEEKWDKLAKNGSVNERQRRRVKAGIEKLKRSLYLGKDPDVLKGYDKVPEDLKTEWVDLLYNYPDHPDPKYLSRLIRILENPSFNLPYQEKSRKSLILLKNLAEIMGQLEKNTNAVLRQVLNGYDNEILQNSGHSLSH